MEDGDGGTEAIKSYEGGIGEGELGARLKFGHIETANFNLRISRQQYPDFIILSYYITPRIAMMALHVWHWSESITGLTYFLFIFTIFTSFTFFSLPIRHLPIRFLIIQIFAFFALNILQVLSPTAMPSAKPHLQENMSPLGTLFL